MELNYEKVVILLDNLFVHRTSIVKELFRDYGIKVVYLPPYF